MHSGIEILPTNTCPSDLTELGERSKLFARFAHEVQLDISDGAFTPALSWPYREGQWSEIESLAEKKNALPYADTLAYEAHLMVEEPLRVGQLLAQIGCSRLIAHIETFDAPSEVPTVFAAWKSAGAREVGLASLLDTPLDAVKNAARYCDVVQLMSIAKLGYQGAAYEPSVIRRIQELHTAHPSLVIEVDGGVSRENIAELVQAGARRFGVGSAISKATDPAAAYAELKSLAESAIQ